MPPSDGADGTGTVASRPPRGDDRAARCRGSDCGLCAEHLSAAPTPRPHKRIDLQPAADAGTVADHLGLTLVHVNRTLRRLREERLALIDRQVVIILDIDGLHSLVRGLPEPSYLPESWMGANSSEAPATAVLR